MGPRMVVVLALAALAPAMMAAAARKTHKGHHAAHEVHEDATFFEGKPFEHAAPISPEVLRVLAKSDEAKDILDSAAEAGRVNTAQLFRAREVHLNHGKDVDLVVIGIPPMSGADHGWFWVIHSARKNPKVVLYAGGDSLKLLGTTTHGYRDIFMILPLASETHCAIYHFEGNEYQIWKEKWMDNGGPPGTGCEGR
jgi:hypothetical protein